MSFTTAVRILDICDTSLADKCSLGALSPHEPPLFMRSSQDILIHDAFDVPIQRRVDSPLSAKTTKSDSLKTSSRTSPLPFLLGTANGSVTLSLC